eukprot:scaffold315993_cov15-Tisochrysis_lutea.AAC.1
MQTSRSKPAPKEWEKAEARCVPYCKEGTARPQLCPDTILCINNDRGTACRALQRVQGCSFVPTHSLRVTSMTQLLCIKCERETACYAPQQAQDHS